jgi:hypothetical protein
MKRLGACMELNKPVEAHVTLFTPLAVGEKIRYENLDDTFFTESMFLMSLLFNLIDPACLYLCKA